MKKRIFSIVLAICLVLTLVPTMVFAETGKTVSFTVTADKTEAQPGDTITFTLTMGPVEGLYYADLNLRIPEGLTYVEGSGSITEGLKDKLKAGELQFYESHGNLLLLHGCDYTSTADTVLMTFRCTVNDDAATGAKTVGVGLYDDDETNCFDVDMDLIAATFNPATVTVSEAPAPVLAITVDGFEVGNTPADCTFSFESTIPGIEFSAADIAGISWRIFDGQSYHDLQDTDTFDADKTYNCYIRLSPKGLTSAPAATVNGNTPFYCDIQGLGPQWLCVYCNMGEPASTITINGPDVICAEENYYFTATASEGVTFDDTFGLGYGIDDYGFLTLDQEADGTAWGVVQTYYYSADSFELTVSGTTKDGTPVSATKTVQVSPEHIYVDGVCGCGAVLTYTVEYIGSGDDPICRDIKTYGQDLTLRGETFTMDGYVQTGWVDKETGAVYNLGDTYTEDADVTLNPVFEKIITLTVPYTTTVALGDAGEPGETTFELALIGDSAPDKDKSNVTVSGSVTTNGKGSYNGTLTITGPEETLWYMISEGALVQQVDDGEDGWTYDDTVWGLLMDEDPIENAPRSMDMATGYRVFVVPTVCEETDDGVYYDIDWYSIDWDNLQSEDMRFTNTYTAHAYELKYNETDHWDECDCGDIQNKEAHTYGNWTVTKEPTETAAGEKEHTCTVCGYTEKAVIAKLSSSDTTKTSQAENKNMKSPQTGNGESALCFAMLLALGGAGIITKSAYGKKKKRSR